MPRAADLDIGDIDASRGKQAEMLTPAGKGSRDLERAGLRDLDERTEKLPGLTRHKKDVNRTMPRDGTGPSVRPRRLPPDSQPRRLTVYRQRILNKQKTALDGVRQQHRTEVDQRPAAKQSLAGDRFEQCDSPGGQISASQASPKISQALMAMPSPTYSTERPVGSTAGWPGSGVGIEPGQRAEGAGGVASRGFSTLRRQRDGHRRVLGDCVHDVVGGVVCLGYRAFVRLFRGKLRSATRSLLHDLLDADGLAIDILHVQPSSDDLTVMDLK